MGGAKGCIHALLRRASDLLPVRPPGVLPPPQVQLLVTVSAAGPRQQQSYQLLDCTPDTTVADVKRRALEAAVANGTAAVPGAGGEEDVAAAASLQELTFLGQCCKDDKQLAGAVHAP